MLYSIILLIYSMIPLFMSMILLYLNMFISIEINLLNSMSFNIPISFMLDWISCLFLSTVMFISSMIILFSMFYIPKTEHKQFFLIMIMFILSMSILILSDNIIFILLGWDGLGLSSYILVIYYQNFSSASSGTITFLSNRMGDIMILMTIAIMTINLNWNFTMNEEMNMFSLLLLMMAACSKSAQFPFSAWLPAAMAAPTPISALVHSSTLVTAGVYLMIRIMNNIHPSSLFLLMMISTMTTIYASMSANWEQDMKKIIALSTLSQIAMMMFAISMKSALLSFFHLIIHALFKSTMFLCAGIMIHNSSYQDMRMMGMNSFNSPLTLSILSISNMALMGIPFMSGFFSKDSILEMMMISKYYSMMSILMTFSIGLTLSYSFRMLFYSNNMLMKMKTDFMFNYSPHAIFSILLISPMSVIMGAMMMWILMPQQLFIFPFLFKLFIPLIMIMGVIMGISLNFKKKFFISVGESAISLWFLHIMTSFMMNIFSSPSSLSNMNDKTWQEIYGPQGSIMLTKNYSNFPLLIIKTLMFLLLLMIILPIMIM